MSGQSWAKRGVHREKSESHDTYNTSRIVARADGFEDLGPQRCGLSPLELPILLYPQLLPFVKRIHSTRSHIDNPDASIAILL